MFAYYQKQKKQRVVAKEEKVNTRIKKERRAHPKVGFSFLDHMPKGEMTDFGNVRSMAELTIGFMNST